jgi:hypothetical protein
LTPVAQIGNGSFNAAKTSPESMANLAMRIRKNNEKLLKNPKLLAAAKKSEQIQKEFEKKLRQSAASLPTPDLAPKALPSTPAQAAAALEKDLKEASSKINGVGANSSGGASAPAKAEPELEFGLTESQLADQQGQLTEAMKQNLDFGQNDISSGSNIFEVLSNRYQRSGMRRLFDESGKTQADKPAQTDISK